MTIQALADGGVKMGLNRDQSIRLAAMSMLVSASVLLFYAGVSVYEYFSNVPAVMSMLENTSLVYMYSFLVRS